jgi:TRAP-type C4-dicarboxylate transport system permease small subunit
VHGYFAAALFNNVFLNISSGYIDWAQFSIFPFNRYKARPADGCWAQIKGELNKELYLQRSFIEMNPIVRLYQIFCKIEELIVASFIAVITFLVFISAIMRLKIINHPLNWATDVSLLLFAWVVFLGADLALRRADFVRVDMLVSKFPAVLQKILYYLFYVLAIGFLVLLIWQGIPLCISNKQRLFQTLGISYSWATVSAPIGAFLLIITILIKLVRHWKDKNIEVKAKEAI